MLEWAWWGPRRIGRALRAQGLKGTEYRFLRGDIKEEQRLKRAALSRPVPMDRPHDIVPRVAPLLHRVTEEHVSCSALLICRGKRREGFIHMVWAIPKNYNQ